jgi:hypothetical protein
MGDGECPAGEAWCMLAVANEILDEKKHGKREQLALL